MKFVIGNIQIVLPDADIKQHWKLAKKLLDLYFDAFSEPEWRSKQ